MLYGITDLTTFILGTVFIVLLPGPNSLYVMAAASRWGVRAGYQGAAGIFGWPWRRRSASAAPDRRPRRTRLI